MQTQHSTFPFAGQTVHRISFDTASFVETDLLWLPHHAKLQHSVKKRQAEHLAGRLAAWYALTDTGFPGIPDIGDNRQPLWPQGWYGSISHNNNTALAVVADTPLGIDIETLILPATCDEIASGIVTPHERARLEASELPFSLALTLTFSAKESLYKAFSARTPSIPDFYAAELLTCEAGHLTLRLTESFAPGLAGHCCAIPWRRFKESVVTLAHG